MLLLLTLWGKRGTATKIPHAVRASTAATRILLGSFVKEEEERVCRGEGFGGSSTSASSPRKRRKSEMQAAAVWRRRMLWERDEEVASSTVKREEEEEIVGVAKLIDPLANVLLSPPHTQSGGGDSLIN